MPDYADTLAELAKARESAKETLTELRGAIKDGRAARKDLVDFIIKSAETFAIATINHKVDHEIDHIQHIITEQTEVMQRRISSVMLSLESKEVKLTELGDFLHNAGESVINSTQKIKDKVADLDNQVGHVIDALRTLREIVEIHQEKLDVLAQYVGLVGTMEVVDAESVAENDASQAAGDS